MSDKYGRRKTLFIGVLLSGVFSLGCVFVQNWWQYAILRLFTGTFSKFLFMLAFLISVEVTGPDYKVWLGILIQVLQTLVRQSNQLFVTAIVFGVPHGIKILTGG